MFPDFIDGDISGILDADFAHFPSQNISHFFMALYRLLLLSWNQVGELRVTICIFWSRKWVLGFFIPSGLVEG